MRDIADEQNAQNGTDSSAGGSSSKAPVRTSNSNGGIGGGGSGGGSGNGAGLGGLAPIHIHIDGQQQTKDGDLYGTAFGAQFIADLARSKANSL